MVPIAIHGEAAIAKLETATCGKQPEIEFVLLTTRLPNPPPSHALQCGPFPKRPPGLRKVPEREQDPGIMGLGNLRLDAKETAVLSFFPDCRAVDDVAIGVELRKLDLSLEFVREQKIVGIEVLQPLTARELEEPVPRGSTAPIWAGFPADAAVEAANDLQAAVR